MTEIPIGQSANGGRILVRCLQEHGVDRIFCVPGESYLPVLDALFDAPDIQLITCRQEGGAAMMAAADGKLSGVPGVCFATRGPGATNASAGVHLAHQGSIPMVLFIGQVERAAQDREAFQEIDYRRMFGQMAKWVAQIDSAERIAEYIQRAFAVATSGRPGPVVLALPEDMLRETAPPAPPLSIPAPSAPAPSPADLKTLRELLAASHKPLVLCGESPWPQSASENLQRWCEREQLPVAAAFRCQDIFNNDHPHYIGDVGLGINPAQRTRIEAADLVIALGGRFSEIVTQNYSVLQPGGPQKVIYAHPSAEELARVPATLRLNTSMANLLEPLLKGTAGEIPQSRRAWLESARNDYLQWTTPGELPGDLQYGHIVTWLREQLPDDAIICNGAGNYSIWVHRFFRYRRSGTQLAPISGSMGYGLPAAIAAKLRYPERPVICFAGDGCLQMTVQELATASHYGVNVVVIVVNNSSLGTIRMHQERNYPGRTSGTDLSNPDFTALALAYGFHAQTVAATEEFFPAFAEAVASDKPALLELMLPLNALTPNLKLSDLQ
ncbi:thiamine pyrophosphate-dependent enzyme [Microbulbifer hainanensis]|uniref:thiamine pyrophosphate-dependent enzyme n=1 Tax=Microbulbifer hainanensis TaxID=2735675 RepID=UPI001868EAB0|nr:thiamine pyrophosphate-dependent enzyme [Microbulbifer hainanensis]